MKWAIRSGLLALFAVLLAGNAKADTVYSYSLTGPGTDVTFDLPEFPTIASGNSFPGSGFYVTPTNLVINGSPSPDALVFYNIASLGAFGDLNDTAAFNLVGDQLYTSADGISADAETDPMMSLGIFTLDDYMGLYVDEPPQTIPYTLNVSVVSTPEPSTLLLFGVGLTGLALLRKGYALSKLF